MLNADILYNLLISDENPTWTCWLDRKLIRDLAEYIARAYAEDKTPNPEASVKSGESYSFHLLSPEKMRDIGFYPKLYEGTRYETDSDYWVFHKPIVFPKEYSDEDYAFVCKIHKETGEGFVYILDEESCHTYDLAYYAARSEFRIIAHIIKPQADEWVEYLTKEGVIERQVES